MTPPRSFWKKNILPRYGFQIFMDNSKKNMNNSELFYIFVKMLSYTPEN